MQFIVDRIEGSKVILENESGFLLEIPQKIMPEAREGDCVSIDVSANGIRVTDVNEGRITLSYCRRTYTIREIPGLSVMPGDYIGFTIDRETADSRLQSIKALENDLFITSE